MIRKGGTIQSRPPSGRRRFAAPPNASVGRWAVRLQEAASAHRRTEKSEVLCLAFGNRPARGREKALAHHFGHDDGCRLAEGQRTNRRKHGDSHQPVALPA